MSSIVDDILHADSWPVTCTEDLLIAGVVLGHGAEFFESIFERGWVCARCGHSFDVGDVAWRSTQILTLDGHFAGVALIYHCCDCPPETLIPEMRARGVWPVETEAWKVVQGKV